MTTNRSYLFRVAALAAVLLTLAGCSILPRETPTPGAALTFTPSPTTSPTAGVQATATEPPTVQPGDTAEPTGTPPPTEGATVTAPTATATSTQAPQAPTATSQPTNTGVPPSPTARPTNTPVPPSPTARPTNTPPPPAITDWRGEYFDDRSLQPPPVVVRNDRVVDFQWAAGQSPAPGIPSENYSARWSRDWNFDTGNYRFQLIVDDGARLWVGGNLIIDAWSDGAPREYSATLYLQGQVPIRLEYYNHLGSGRARLNWDRVTSYPDWLGSYYKGTDLTGLPYFQRNDPSIDFNWGAGAPRSDMPADNFSVRWSRRVNLDRAGNYRFQIAADDGVRFWVDGRLVVDDWTDGYKERDISLSLTAGGHDLRLDYYERLGGALIRLSITYVTAPATATSTVTATPTATATRQPPTATFTPTATRQPPTATFTPTATGQPPTATFTPTATGQPPTATFTPTPQPPTSPPPLRPDITLQAIQGEENRALRVTGTGWPANTPVDLFLNRIMPEGELMTNVGQVTTGSQGNFVTRVDLLPLQELRRAQSLQIVARTPDGAYEARATIQVFGGLLPTPGAPPVVVTPGGGMGGIGSPVPFRPMRATAERFALTEPTYLVLDSAEAWAQYFGSEPPPGDPRVNWEREYVVGAFLGAQPPNVSADVAAVTARDGTIVVRLSSPVAATPVEGQQNVARSFIRIERAEVERVLGGAAEPSFAFVDAGGALLAQGTPGAEPLGSGMSLRSAPAPSEPGALALPGESAEQTPEAQALKEAPAEVPEEAPAEVPEEAPAEVPDELPDEAPAEEDVPEAATEAETEAQPAPRTAALGWVVLAVWAIAIAALAAGAYLLIRHLRRS